MELLHYLPKIGYGRLLACVVGVVLRTLARVSNHNATLERTPYGRQSRGDEQR